MKSKTHLLVGLLLCTLWSLTAQSNLDISTLLSRLDQNHSTSITDVFSTSEIETLRAHFDAQNDLSVEPSQSEFSGEIYAPENTNGNFGHFSSSTPSTYDVVGPSGTAEFEGAGAYDDFTGLYYVVDNVGNAYAVDPVSGDYAPLPPVTAPNGESFTGLEFDPLTGDLFAISTDGAGSSTISVIDPVTGSVTVIGDTQIVLAVAMAMSSLGDYMYVLDVDTDTILEVSKTTAIATPLGSIGFDCNFGQGMFLSDAGQVYLTAFNNDTFRSELRMLNQNTGATSLISPIGDASFPGQTLQFAWASIFKSILGGSDKSITNFALYPNPADQALQISHIDNLERIAITTLLGQLVLEVNANQIDTAIDVSSLATGNYLVQITTAKGSATRQLIKK